ncbi:hypothetical protein BGW38_010201 [Lunasporangiospora selenospora]|uniref:Uncharacterized protein n=1 Tax=Lunasporangiospora selenospora TaxID=979761 RepID=A0A9P6FX82_9FUNG|nr:hypothetical protein BGW38_010201 [Lunasporangiospora selenospora]
MPAAATSSRRRAYPSISPSLSSPCSGPVTRLRYRQLVQPITPTELEQLSESNASITSSASALSLDQSDLTSTASLIEGSPAPGMRFPRVELSSLDLAKPRIYTRLLYFFEARPSLVPLSEQQQQQDPHHNGHVGSSSPASSSYPSFSSSASPTSATAKAKAPSTQDQSKKTASRRSHGSNTYKHFQYHETELMDPMLLQASLALVLSDFFPLAGRITTDFRPEHHPASDVPETEQTTNSSSSNGAPKLDRPFIECNDRGVLFAVADTTATMQQIREGEFQDSVLPPHLFPLGLYPATLRDPPIMAIQLTYTSSYYRRDGDSSPFPMDQMYSCPPSLIMSVAVDSCVMDATSLVSFMTAWSKITQGQDFSPYPILDRALIEKHGHEVGPGSGAGSGAAGTPSPNAAAAATTAGAPTGGTGVYRHQRVNNSPPPPAFFDNRPRNGLDTGLCAVSNSSSESEDSECLGEERIDEDGRDDESNASVHPTEHALQTRVEGEGDSRSESLAEHAEKRIGGLNPKEDAGPQRGQTILQTIVGTTEGVPDLEPSVDFASVPEGYVVHDQETKQNRRASLPNHRHPRRRPEQDDSEVDGSGDSDEGEEGRGWSNGGRGKGPTRDRLNLHLFHFTPQQLERIKKLASEQNIAAAACAADDKEISDKWVSTGDALIAYLWKLTTISRRMEPDCKLMCGLVMDIRKRVNPPVPDGFLGNAHLSVHVQMPVHSLLTTPLSLPSRLIRDELILQTPELINSAIAWIQRQETPHLIEAETSNPFGHDFMVWSFRKLDMYNLDFGQGAPIKVRIGCGGFGGGEGMCVIMDSEPTRQGRRGLGLSPVSGVDGSGVGEGGGGGSSSVGGGSGSGISSSNGGNAGGSSPPTPGKQGAPGNYGVDVYLGLEGEHLQDFAEVHRGFMEGLVDDWEVV